MLTDRAAVIRSRAALQRVGWLELHLGTRVEISCRAGSNDAGRAAVAAAFAEIQDIHRLMSFHQANSDVSRLNRLAARQPVEVDPRTVAVIRSACELSRSSQGHFDITTAAELVSRGHLPRPASSDAPDPEATWRDIEIVSDNAVAFRRPLWLDLGGIAKGFAVDRALQRCMAGEVEACVVNAGGDCRVSDGLTASVTLDVPSRLAKDTATIELSAGSIASSCTDPAGSANVTGPHYNGSTRRPLTRSPRTPAFVSVLADDCIVADALTKVVLSLGDAARPILASRGATAFVLDETTGWRQIPAVRSIRRDAHG